MTPFPSAASNTHTPYQLHLLHPIVSLTFWPFSFIYLHLRSPITPKKIATTTPTQGTTTSRAMVEGPDKPPSLPEPLDSGEAEAEGWGEAKGEDEGGKVVEEEADEKGEAFEETGTTGEDVDEDVEIDDESEDLALISDARAVV